MGVLLRNALVEADAAGEYRESALNRVYSSEALQLRLLEPIRREHPHVRALRPSKHHLRNDFTGSRRERDPPWSHRGGDVDVGRERADDGLPVRGDRAIAELRETMGGGG